MLSKNENSHDDVGRQSRPHARPQLAESWTVRARRVCTYVQQYKVKSDLHVTYIIHRIDVSDTERGRYGEEKANGSRQNG